MKNKRNLLFFLLFLSMHSFAQVPDWIWARSAVNTTGLGGNYGSSASPDGNGNIYVAGIFSGSEISFGSITLTSTGLQNIFIVKYGSTGNVIWATSVRGDGFLSNPEITSDRSGNIYITGSYYGSSVIFDSITLDPKAKSESVDIFIAKYDSSGKAKWAKSAGGYYDDASGSIISDKSGGIYITGYFESHKIIFDNDTLWNTGKNHSPEIYVCKYDSAGNLKWANQAAGNGSDYPGGACIDPKGNLYVTGNFGSSSIAFGKDTLYNSDSISGSAFIVKYDPSGNVFWAKVESEPNSESSHGICCDRSGNIFLTGYFSDTASFGNDTLLSKGSADMVVVKYDSSGNEQWAKGAGGINYDNCVTVATDASGSAYIAGTFTSPVIYFDKDTLVNNGQENMVIAKYDPSGNLVWIKSALGSDYYNGADIKIDASGSVFITGSFSSSLIIFGNDTLIKRTGDYSEMFCAKLSSTVSGIAQVKNQNSFLVFPNPASGLITIALPKNRTGQIQITNLLGQIIFTENLSTTDLTPITIDLSKFPKGMYLITATTPFEKYESRFLKQ